MKINKTYTINKLTTLLFSVLLSGFAFSQNPNPVQIVNYDNNSNNPDVLVKNAFYQDGDLYLNLDNKVKATTFYVNGKYANADNNKVEKIKYLIVLDSNNLNQIVVPADNILYIEFNLTNGTTNNRDYIYYSNTIKTTNIENTTATKEIKLDVYPNPFVTTANIQIDLKNASDVKLAVYDLTGSKVNTVADSFYPSGKSTISLNDNLPSGIYFCKMTAGNHTEIKKIVKK